jgi:dienelactone hydrolase
MHMTITSFAATSTSVTFNQDGKTFQGDLYLPRNAKGPSPLVIVVHAWWGKSRHPIERAKRIADDLGYAALAVDLYGDGKTVGTPQEAQALAMPFYEDPWMGVERIKKFIEVAPTNFVDVSSVVSIGYCFGGTQSLNLARSGIMPHGSTLLGVVSFHGGLSSSLKPQEPIKARLLVLHGAADKLVTAQDVLAFKEEMKRASADLTFIAYPGALHAFTDPDSTTIGNTFNIPVAYDAKADEDSWNKLKEFLKESFSSISSDCPAHSETLRACSSSGLRSSSR